MLAVFDQPPVSTGPEFFFENVTLTQELKVPLETLLLGTRGLERGIQQASLKAALATGTSTCSAKPPEFLALDEAHRSPSVLLLSSLAVFIFNKFTKLFFNFLGPQPPFH